MEIIIGLIVIVVVGLLWHTNTKKKSEAIEESLVVPKATVNAADLAQPLVITPSLNPMQSLPVTVAEPSPVVESITPLPEAKPAKVKKAPAAKKPAAAKTAAKKAPAKTAAKKTPARKSGGKKVG